MRPSAILEANRAAVREAVSRYRLTNPRIFGSVLHGTDIDLLTPGDLPKKFRDKVIAEAKPI